MKFIAVFVGILAFVAADVDPITSRMVPIEPALAKYLSAAKFSLKYGEVDRADVPVVQRYDRISASLVAMLENLRGSFGTGTETMPPLDPYTIDSIDPIDISLQSVITGTLNVQNIETRGLKGFVIENMTFSYIGTTLRFFVRVPVVNVDAQYQLNSRVAMIIPYNPNGNASLQIDDLSVNGYAGLGLTSDGYLKLSSFKLNFDFDIVNVHVDGVIEDGLVNSYFLSILDGFANGVLGDRTDLISAAVTAFVRDSVNDFIGQYRPADLLA